MKLSSSILLGCILSIQLSFASTNPLLDSLSQALAIEHQDTNRVNLLNQLAWEYRRSDVKAMLDHAEKALVESRRIHYLKGEAKALYYLAVAAIVQGDGEKAMEYNKSALQIARQINDKKQMASSINALGILYYNDGDLENALKYYQQTLKYAEEANDKRLLSVSSYNIGLLHDKQGNKRKAMEYFHKSAAIGIASGNTSILSLAYQSMGMIYQERKQYEAAMEYLEKALEISIEMSDDLARGNSLMAMGDLFAEEGKYDTALSHLKNAYEIFKVIGNTEMDPYILNSLSETYCKMGKFKEGIEAGEACLEAAQQMNLRSQLPDIYKNLSANYASAKQYEKAYQFHKLYKEGQDSLLNNDKDQLIAELETKYQIEKKEAENQLLKEKQALHEASIRSRSLITLMAILLMLMVSGAAVTLWKANRQKKNYNLLLEEEVEARTKELVASNEALRKSNEELEHFTYIASHDLKEPLRNITGFCKLIERKLSSEADETLLEYLEFVRRNARQMHTLVQDVLEYSKINKKDESLVSVDANTIMEQVEQSLESTLQQKNAAIQYEELPVLYTNSAQLYLIIKNLVTNGIKYNRSPIPVIKVSYKRQLGKHIFAIQDNGIGIEKEYQSQIFEMFKRLHNREEYQGSGLGLAICHKIVQNFGGELWVESAPARGSIFYFSIPVLGEETPAANETELLLSQIEASVNYSAS